MDNLNTDTLIDFMPLINRSINEFAKCYDYDSYHLMPKDQDLVDKAEEWYETTYGLKLQFQLIGDRSMRLLPPVFKQKIVVDEEKYFVFLLKYK